MRFFLSRHPQLSVIARYFHPPFSRLAPVKKTLPGFAIFCEDSKSRLASLRLGVRFWLMQEALVLERKGELALRKIELPQQLGPHDVKVAIQTVGICASDVHYYEYGKIGPFVVNAPMVLGHEAAGVVVEVGEQVKNLKKGDRVCMEPGIPDPNSRAARLGIYNLDPAVRFWATPPVHGCLTGTVIHPAAYTFKLPDRPLYGSGPGSPQGVIDQLT